MEIPLTDCPVPAAPSNSAPDAPPALTLVPSERGDTDLSVDELGSRIVGLSARLAAATCRWLVLVAEFDARHGYEHFGLASTARWLGHACGISHRTAVEHVRVARSLAVFPELTAALAAGRISYSHARAITRVTGQEPAAAAAEQPDEHLDAQPDAAQDARRDAADVELVADLIGIAEHGTVGQLETVVRGLRTVEQTESHSDGDVPVEEYVRHGWAARSSHWTLSARLDPEKGALVERAVAAIAAAENLCPGDALTRIAEIALAALTHAGDGLPRGLRGDERAAVLIHLSAADVPAPPEPAPAEPSSVDAPVPADLAEPVEHRESCAARRSAPRSPERDPVSGAGSEPRPFARLDNGPGLSRRTTEWLLCQARLRTVLHDTDGNVLDLGRSHRVVTERQFRALLLRDRHCSHPGCVSRHRLEAHHVRHWLYDGRTDLDNLILLCPRHHHAHHDGAFTVRRVADSFEFRRADGRVLESHVEPARLVDTSTSIETDHREIPDRATLTAGAGDRLDRAWAIAVLASRRTRHGAPQAA